MGKEYIDYSDGVPVYIDFLTITEYPIHWQNAIEILYVVKGKVQVEINEEKFELEENEIEIINEGEVHRLYSKDKDNKVLVFHIDQYFFEKYYNDIENMFFYTNTSDKGVQESEEYDQLRTFLSIILCEYVQKTDNYDEEIESVLVKLLYFLINNFHYLMYEQEELKENGEQLERYHRIAKYIFNNYNNNITLQDIADKEFLSTYYLSHEIKYATGYSFTDLINITRVQESVKLLVDTDKSISEISEEIGFSHTRYFNKNFKLYYKTSPSSFRKKNKIDEAAYEKRKKLTSHPISEALDFVLYYLEDYDRFNSEDKINKIDIDMSKESGVFNKEFKNVLNVGEAFDLLIEDNKEMLEELQEEIGYSYVRLINVFSADMGIFKDTSFYNWSRDLTVFEYIRSLKLKPMIILGDSEYNPEEALKALKSFLKFFSNVDSISVDEFAFQFAKGTNEIYLKEASDLIRSEYKLIIAEGYYDASLNLDPIYDTAYMLPYIIENEIKGNVHLNELRAYDVLDHQVELTNEVFFGYPGLLNDKGIKKPSFYAYYLLNKLGDCLVERGNGYIATKSDSEYQVLLYSHNEDIDNLIKLKSYSKLRGLKNSKEKKFSINITQIASSVRITKYVIDEEIGSSYNYWANMGKPIRLSKEEKEIIHKASFPQVSFEFTKKSAVLNILTELTGYGAVLIVIKEVQRHLK